MYINYNLFSIITTAQNAKLVASLHHYETNKQVTTCEHITLNIKRKKIQEVLTNYNYDAPQ